MFARYASKALFASAAVAATLVFVVAPASAETRTRAVSYADLNLQTEAGVNTLNRRIRTAARQVCGQPASRGVRELMDIASCRTNALASANRAVVTVLASVESGDQLALGARSITVGND